MARVAMQKCTSVISASLSFKNSESRSYSAPGIAGVKSDCQLLASTLVDSSARAMVLSHNRSHSVNRSQQQGWVTLTATRLIVTVRVTSKAVFCKFA